jgi:hypothetical protein
MFKDRSDQIQKITVSSAAGDQFNQRFDLNAPVGFGGNGADVKTVDFELEFKSPQQVAGIIVKNTPEGKFKPPTAYDISFKNNANEQYKSNGI